MKKSISAIALMAFISTAACSPKAAPEASKSQPAPQQDAAQYVSVRTDVPNKAFYKDVFMDGALHLDEYADLPFLSRLNLDREYLMLTKSTMENRNLEVSIFGGGKDDANGVLLYPDGEPRFRMLYVNGGGANSAGAKMEYSGREAVRTFVANGGCFVGNCAGAYMASCGTERNFHNGYIGVWPGNCSLAETPVWAVGYIIPHDSPILKYYDFGGDFYIDSVRHHNGPYFADFASVPGTEVLTINDYPAYKFHHKPSAIAYKADCYSGRVIPIGGHPEKITEGERFDLMTAYVRYALDGQGCAKVKGILSNGELRRMTKSTEDDDPAFTKIGDRQCHHFAFALPKKARNVVVRVESLEGYELSLRLANGTFAFKEDAQYAAEGREKVKELKFDELPAGTWYVGVQCEETVHATQTETHFIYNNTAILNGAPYTVSVKWDEAATGRAVLTRGQDINERIKQMANPRRLVTENDSTITKIAFRTGVTAVDGVRIDDRNVSEEPVWLTVKDGVATISTPAANVNLGRISSYLFNGFTALKEIENLEAVRTDGVNSLISLFAGCASLGNVDLSNFNTSEVKAMQAMFNGCASMTKVDISNFDLGRTVNMTRMFRGMPSLREINICDLGENAREAISVLFISKDDNASNGTASKSKALDVKCVAKDAQWLLESPLKSLAAGTEKCAPVDVRLFDIATGSEIR